MQFQPVIDDTIKLGVGKEGRRKKDKRRKTDNNLGKPGRVRPKLARGKKKDLSPSSKIVW